MSGTRRATVQPADLGEAPGRGIRRPLLLVAIQIPNRANGGIESFSQILFNLARYRPIVLTNVESERTQSWREAGVETHVIAEAASGRGFSSAPLSHLRAYYQYGRAALRLARRHGIKIVYANDPLAMQFMYPLAAAGRLRSLFAIRNMPDPGINQSRRKFRALYGICSRVLFLSHDMAERWNRFTRGFGSPYSVTYSIVDDRLFKTPRRRDAAAPFVLLPARITPPKRQLEFIRYVAPGLVEAGLRILIAGDASTADAEYEQECRRAAAPLGEAVEFLGFRKDLTDLYSQASVVVVGARLEGLARAMIEGMACGCPVVSFDVCSAAEVLSEGGGIVVPSADWEAIGRAIVDLCTDEQRLIEMGRRARETARKLFNGKDVIARYEQAFDLVAAQA